MIKEKEKFEILLENVSTDIKAVAEGQSVLQRQVDSLGQDVKALDKKVDAVHSSLKNEIKVTAMALDSKIEEIRSDLKEHIRQPHAV